MSFGGGILKKTWRCTVCGYLHKGESPPDVCPVCYADASKFEPVMENDSVATRADARAGLLREMLEAFVPHAVSAHFPVALIPTTALFIALSWITARESFATSAVYLLVIAVVAVPLTFLTGLYDWKTRYAGEMAPIFRNKIILACVLLSLGVILLCWYWQDPDILSAGGGAAGLFSLVVLLMLACVTLLGHYGGMLVLGSRREKHRGESK